MANLKAVPELAQLRDIHMPLPINWWPLAPRGYCLLLVLLLLGGLLWIYGRRYYQNGRAKRAALQLLSQYRLASQQQDSQMTCAQVSMLLRRVALAYYPRKEVASLQGDDWILFLNKTANRVRWGRKLDFNRVRKELLQLPYCPTHQPNQLPLLLRMAAIWIKRRGRMCSS